MRYVSLPRLQEGMVLGNNIYGENFEIVMGEGLVLGNTQIRRLNELGYPGVYILDKLSEDVVVQDVIPTQLRLSTIKAAKDLRIQAERMDPKNPRKTSVTPQQKIVLSIIEALIANKRRVVDRIDLKPFENYDFYHAANVVVLSLLLGVEMGISGTQLYELGMASLLYDLGNIFLPKEILSHPGKLSPEEYQTVQKHTQIGFEFLRDNFEISIDACVGALHHHEHYDGSGYPYGLKKHKISIYGRIIALADVYDALVSRRPFRAPKFPPEAMEYIQSKSGTMFDPEIVAVLRRVVSLYPAGTCVQLSSGVQCMVVQNYVAAPERPRLRLLGNRSATPLYIDLQNDPAFAHLKVSHLLDV
ncbi:MAG: HD-GYP domain-containing protein [Oscillospiraceae bacterium]|jgi:HD-GYP domain-containing protein (c-di-GMP phosphodiesterase class II)